MIIKHAKVLNEQFEFTEKDLCFEDTILSTAGGEEIDAAGCYVLPGLVDVHTHGALGFDANDDALDYDAWQAFLLKNGVTSFLPTTVTDTEENIVKALQKLEGSLGVNMEGPYISGEKRGAHAPEKICAIDLDFMERVKEQVKITTVAPEAYDNMDKISALTGMGIRVALGHSMADYDASKEAIQKGATQITHIFNCCPPLGHREPGLVGAALENENVYCEVISDGVHLHPSVVRFLYQTLGTERMVLISDAISATGLSDGKYNLAGLEVFVKGGEARLASGNLAGSTVTLYEAVKRAVSFGIPLSDAVKMASYTPAKALGLSGIGSLAVGNDADILVVDKELNIKHVFYKGKQIV